MTTATFSRINLWIDNANGATGWMVRAIRTDGTVVEEPIGSLQGEVRGRYDLPLVVILDAEDLLGMSLPGPAHWTWTGEVHTLGLDASHADPTANIDGEIVAAADEWLAQGGEHAIVAADIDAIAEAENVRPAFVAKRAKALGVPVL